MKKVIAFIKNAWLFYRAMALCRNCAVPMREYHGTGYLICPKCGELD